MLPLKRNCSRPFQTLVDDLSQERSDFEKPVIDVLPLATLLFSGNFDLLALRGEPKLC